MTFVVLRNHSKEQLFHRSMRLACIRWNGRFLTNCVVDWLPLALELGWNVMFGLISPHGSGRERPVV
jgi:hypothetical protein